MGYTYEALADLQAQTLTRVLKFKCRIDSTQFSVAYVVDTMTPQKC